MGKKVIYSILIAVSVFAAIIAMFLSISGKVDFIKSITIVSFFSIGIVVLFYGLTISKKGKIFAQIDTTRMNNKDKNIIAVCDVALGLTCFLIALNFKTMMLFKVVLYVGSLYFVWLGLKLFLKKRMDR